MSEIKTDVEKRLSTPRVKDTWVNATVTNGQMMSLEVFFDWTSPLNSAHKMNFSVQADGPCWKPLSNKPLILVEALEELARTAREVYEAAMAEGTEKVADGRF